MTERTPAFDDLVGTDLTPEERERLLRVHEALLAAGPPPELSPGAAAPATSGQAATRLALRRRRLPMRLALAAALGVLVFAVGFLVGDARDEPGTFDVIAMTGTPAAADAAASLELFDVDEAGNWPMEIRIRGLQPARDGRAYELWLTRRGKLSALCGSFRVRSDGTAVVPMNAPYKLIDFDGWVVVREGSTTPLLTT